MSGAGNSTTYGASQHLPLVFPPLDLYHPTTLAATLVITILALLWTRFWTGRSSPPRSIASDGTHAVPAVPYWLPFLGHLLQMAWDASAFSTSLREEYAQGVFAIHLAGSKHNIVYTPGLATALMNSPSTIADAEAIHARMMTRVFGVPTKELPLLDAALPDLVSCYKHMLSEPSLTKMMLRLSASVRVNAPSLVTFSRSPVDEMIWERSSRVRTTTDGEGDAVVEASLLPLIRDFCAHGANAALVGSNFLPNFPDYFDDLWTMDRAFLMLAAGLPRWLPILSLTRAHLAKKKLLQRLTVFHTALERHANGEDPGQGWEDLDDISELLQARLGMYRKHGLSIGTRAGLENSLLWAANANSNTLVFWMVNRIYSDADLLARLRDEITPYIRAVQPRRILPVAEAPVFETLDLDGLYHRCPLLKSCYVESLRLDTASWSMKVLKRDFVLRSREKEGPSAWMLRKGEYAHAAHDLHNTDPRFFEQPLLWAGDRHVRTSKDDGGEEVVSADMGSVRSYGGGSSMCKGRAFAFKQIMVFVAVIISLWEMEPAGSGKWQMPRHVKATGSYNTSDDTRVWIKRRRLPEQGQRQEGKQQEEEETSS